MPTKAELQAQLDRRATDLPTVPTVLAVPIMAVGALLTVGVLYRIAVDMAGAAGTFSPWLLAIPALVSWGSLHLHAKAYYPLRMYGTGPRDAARWLCAAGGLSASAWLVWTGYRGPELTWPWLLIGSGCVTVAWWALLIIAERYVMDPEPEKAEDSDTAHEMPWASILKAAEPKASITGIEYHRAGARLTIEPARHVREDGTVIDDDLTFEEFAQCASRFASNAAREYRRRCGERLPLNSTRPEVGRDDAEFVLHVTMTNVFGADTTYVPATSAQDIHEPKDLGEYEDATRIMISLLSGHAKIVGMTGSGKSVEANNWIARITECDNALVWVCATDKLIPLIFPWLRSWFDGSASQPVLDYVAGKHVDHVLGMLAAAYKLCCDRNDRLADESKMKASQREPAVFVFIEEVSHATEFRNTIQTHDGQTCGLTDLMMLIGRGGRSANVRLVLLAQTALNSSLGDAAPEIIRQLAIRVCLRTMEAHDGFRTIPALNHVDTTILPLHTKIVQPSIEIARAMPGKAAALDGTAAINEVARRNSAWRPVGGVEPESDLGLRYRTRWHPALLPELDKAVTRAGLTWRAPALVVGNPLPGDGPALSPVTDLVNLTKGGTVNTPTWTDGDDAAVQDLLDGDQSKTHSRPFQLPDAATGIARLKAAAAAIGQPDEKPKPPPLPEPLNRIIEWIENQDEQPGFYLSADIAEAIGYTDPIKLGRDIYRVTRVRSRNALAHEAAGKVRPKGYDRDALLDAAARIRSGG